MTALQDYRELEDFALTIRQQFHHHVYLRPRRRSLINHRIMARSGLAALTNCCVAKMLLRQRTTEQFIDGIYFSNLSDA
jgi:hypothetical protein